MTYDYVLTAHIPASPQAVFDAWMSSEGDASVTGGAAVVDPSIGGPFTAWDGYIWGETLEIEPGQRVVQSWRTTDFRDEDADSQIHVLFAPGVDGTVLTLRHTNVPEHDPDYEGSGWEENYFAPMRDYFGSAPGVSVVDPKPR